MTDQHDVEDAAERADHSGLEWHEGPSIQEPIATDYVRCNAKGEPLPPPDDPTYDPHHI